MKTMEPLRFEVVVIGGGPAGYTAGMYASRAELKTLVLEGPNPGGQANMTDLIENYPGLADPLSGGELADNMRKQAQHFGAALEFATVEDLKKGGEVFTISLDDGRVVIGDAVVIASGVSPRRLQVPGETRLTGMGVSYCATCDAPFYRDKMVVVVGGGDSAIKESIHLAKFAKQVTVIHRRDQLRAEKVVQRAAFGNPRLVFMWNRLVEGILGDNLVEGVRVRHLLDDSYEDMATDGVFVFVGADPNSAYLNRFAVLDEFGRVVTDLDMKTSVPGLFAAGDVRAKALRQVVTAVGDGAAAAFAAQAYLEERSFH